MLDFDATLVRSHSDKEEAAPNDKRGYGFHPLLVYLDATGEALAGRLRPGTPAPAPPPTTSPCSTLAQLPVDPREQQVIVRSDAAGLTHDFLDACRERRVRFLVGYHLTGAVRAALCTVPEARWQPALSADGSEEREGAEVAEVSDLVDLSP